MIYLVEGNDTKKINSFLEDIYQDERPTVISKEEVSKDMILSCAESKSLFGDRHIFLMESFIKEGVVSFSKEELTVLDQVENVFIFLEDKIRATDLKVYKNFSTFNSFNQSKIKVVPKTNIFEIADLFSRKNKIGAWVSFLKAIQSGVQPEEITGILLWKIRMMFLDNNKFFTKEELSHNFSFLNDLYHLGHLGKIDFTLGLEQFILSSLSK